MGKGTKVFDAELAGVVEALQQATQQATGSSITILKLIASHCAQGLKKVTLELGGNCPFLVFDNANLGHTLN